MNSFCFKSHRKRNFGHKRRNLQKNYHRFKASKPCDDCRQSEVLHGTKQRPCALSFINKVRSFRVPVRLRRNLSSFSNSKAAN